MGGKKSVLRIITCLSFGKYFWNVLRMLRKMCESAEQGGAICIGKCALIPEKCGFRSLSEQKLQRIHLPC